VTEQLEPLAVEVIELPLTMAFQPSGAPSGKHHEGIADPR
jgi:hypothetical protein